ncbi:sulfurtransferase [Vibrio sp. S11_S32]|uniref:sulfurtransferase n=1 Tax=Vibrio sp. S11_S32 TaxID=2720225 RepID=UPI0016815155|nr:sulfurtransferase [Vibrio sp. S11_S32]MBD1577621.1 sulfurtransferase [Vibrio sp. S11_S32]
MFLVSKNKIKHWLGTTIVFTSICISWPVLADNATSTQIIDCRASEYFNGWPQEGMKLGGHIPNAVNIRGQWLDNMSVAERTHFLVDQKQLNKNQPIKIYCDSGNAKKLQQQLTGIDFKSVAIMQKPLSDFQDQLVALPHFKTLVSPRWLNLLVSHSSSNDAQLVAAPQHDFKIIEAGWGPATGYLLSHVKGAIYANTNDFESKPLWNVVPPAQLQQNIEKLGITQDTTVVLYGRDNLDAARIAQILMYAGVKDVRLLDGGWEAWQAADLPTQSGNNSVKNVVKFGAKVPAHPEYITDVSQVKTMLKDSDNNSLVSVRTWSEYIGDTSGYSYIKPKGRIDGAKWGQGGKNSNNLDDFTNPDGTMRSASEIQSKWQAWNIRTDQKVSFYCGTGWRASAVFLYAYAMGWNNISVFDGGWYQWSLDGNNPTLTGTPSAVH